MWNPFRRKQSELVGLLSTVIENQNKTNQAVMHAAEEMAAASAKQAEVLHQYLDLFKVQSDPERWVAEPEQDNKADLLKAGLKPDATEAEIAQFVLKQLELM